MKSVSGAGTLSQEGECQNGKAERDLYEDLRWRIACGMGTVSRWAQFDVNRAAWPPVSHFLPPFGSNPSPLPGPPGTSGSLVDL